GVRLEGWKIPAQQISGVLIKNATNTSIAILHKFDHMLRRDLTLTLLGRSCMRAAWRMQRHWGLIATTSCPTEPVTCEAHPFFFQMKESRRVLIPLLVQDRTVAESGLHHQQSNFLSVMPWVVVVVAQKNPGALGPVARPSLPVSTCPPESECYPYLGSPFLVRTMICSHINSLSENNDLLSHLFLK
ncbi:hypothetical protein Taro_030299, partial [Colocasia esculenta]|nr:hypothetical protein [Colocasia esculenta]